MPGVVKRRRRGDRILAPEAAEVIGCSEQTVRELIRVGLLTPDRPLGRGRGKPVWLSRRQVESLGKKLRAGG